MTDHNSWVPTASPKIIKKRAEMLQTIREFMRHHKVLEVETPVLCNSTVTDPHIESLSSKIHIGDNQAGKTFYLQTSPEYAMKRLLASGIGAIYQITRVFRDMESGKVHNPEFTLLEWYQPGYDHHGMMKAVEKLLSKFGFEHCDYYSYADIFKSHTGINPHLVENNELLKLSNLLGLHTENHERAFMLDFIFNKQIASNLKSDKPVFIYDYPECMSALARLSGDPPRAERFEVYINRIEIANGYNELCDVNEQKKRFEINREYRQQNGMQNYEIDTRFINALEHGMPACAGVAIGLDRLLMITTKSDDIRDVLTFPFDVA